MYQLSVQPIETCKIYLDCVEEKYHVFHNFSLSYHQLCNMCFRTHLHQCRAPPFIKVLNPCCFHRHLTLIKGVNPYFPRYMTLMTTQSFGKNKIVIWYCRCHFKETKFQYVDFSPCLHSIFSHMLMYPDPHKLGNSPHLLSCKKDNNITMVNSQAERPISISCPNFKYHII